MIEPSRDLAAATRAFAQSLKEVDPLIPVSAMQPIEERIGTSVALPRLYATLVGIFAGAALFLAALGVYGVMAYSVTQREREIGSFSPSCSSASRHSTCRRSLWSRQCLAWRRYLPRGFRRGGP